MLDLLFALHFWLSFHEFRSHFHDFPCLALTRCICFLNHGIGMAACSHFWLGWDGCTSRRGATPWRWTWEEEGHSNDWSGQPRSHAWSKGAWDKPRSSGQRRAWEEEEEEERGHRRSWEESGQHRKGSEGSKAGSAADGSLTGTPKTRRRKTGTGAGVVWPRVGPREEPEQAPASRLSRKRKRDGRRRRNRSGPRAGPGSTAPTSRDEITLSPSLAQHPIHPMDGPREPDRAAKLGKAGCPADTESVPEQLLVALRERAAVPAGPPREEGLCSREQAVLLATDLQTQEAKRAAPQIGHAEAASGQRRKLGLQRLQAASGQRRKLGLQRLAETAGSQRAAPQTGPAETARSARAAPPAETAASERAAPQTWPAENTPSQPAPLP